MATERQLVSLVVNGQTREAYAEPRRSLADFLREDLELTGTHVGCEQGVCGACTVVMDGVAVRSCLTFAVQAAGSQVLTVEGLASGDRMHPIQEAFWESHGMQCGFCTPGFVMSTYAMLADGPNLPAEAIRPALSGNICRCTGYQSIVEAVKLAGDKLRAEGATAGPAGAAPAGERPSVAGAA